MKKADTVAQTREKCLRDLFESQVDRTPDALALIGEKEILTYAELDRRTNRLAHALRARGVGPSSMIGILLERGPQPIVAVLAILKTGAAYVPLDSAYPPERIQGILEEAEAELLLTETSLAPQLPDRLRTPLLILDRLSGELASRPEARLEDLGTPESLSYLIFTSGTTGRPKGIMTENRGVVEFVHAFNEVCGTGPYDRVYQGFSMTFDGSVEEMWMALSNGSALVVPSPTAPKFGDELAAYLEDQRVTYFSTVPTLLSTMTRPIQSLKTLVVSGEICSQELVQKWVDPVRQPGLRMFNVYGPTEATVNTTAAECLPDRRVTIGKPLNGYHLHILDAEDPDLREVPQGREGELFVAGATLARGYLKRPELTAEKFPIIRGTRMYRTGDRVRLNPLGELEFLGRIDTQVKIRGYRVELAEIESILLEQPEITQACVKLVEEKGLQKLAAYVTLQDPIATFSRGEVLNALETRLPAYMVPAYLDVLGVFPVLTSGKIDRARLPSPVAPLHHQASVVIHPETESERLIAEIWAKVLGLTVESVSADDDFFLRLGGHSLAAARVVTLLRARTRRYITVRDAYDHPILRELAKRLDTLPVIEEPRASSAREEAPTTATTLTASLLVPALQAISIVGLHTIAAIPVVIVFLAAFHWLYDGLALESAIWISLAVTILTWPYLLLLSIAAKWLIIGRFKAGRFSLGSLAYFRLWLTGRVVALSGAGALAGTPLMPLYLRAMGARVGRNTWINSAAIGCFDLVRIGDETTIGADTQILGYRVERGNVFVGTADIGDRCYLGLHSALGLNTRMGSESRLGDQSLLPDGASIPEGASMQGSPCKAAEVAIPQVRRTMSRRGLALLAAAQLVILHMLPLFFLLSWVPFLPLIYYAFRDHGLVSGSAVLIAWVPAGTVIMALEIALAKRLVLARAQPGIYPILSTFYLRKWVSDVLMSSARAVLLPLYTTLYFPPWLRLLGAKIGKRAELSTVWAFSPELVDVGDESFFADGSIIGGKRVFGGSFEIGINRIGRRTFVGNSAILPVGASMGDSCLLGVQSITPGKPSCTENGTEWLGSPAFYLPNRPKVGGFTDAVTFKPTPKLYFQRAVIDGLRVLLPGYIVLSGGVIAAILLSFVYRKHGVLGMFAFSPGLAVLEGLYAVTLVSGIKWLVMGRFEPVIVPLWSMYVWLNEMVNGIYESAMAPVLAAYLGTPFVAPLLKLLGIRIGRQAHIETTLFSEFDLVEIGDRVALGHGAVVQTHLFEDRIMKSSTLKIGDDCSVGNMAVVLYDAEMQDRSYLGPLSLLMKGEKLAQGARAHGILTVAITEPAGSWLPGLRTEAETITLPDAQVEIQ
jgi:non-ribosomal peptide synthetase-like protein